MTFPAGCITFASVWCCAARCLHSYLACATAVSKPHRCGFRFVQSLCSKDSLSLHVAAPLCLLVLRPLGSDPNSLEFAGRLVQRTLLTIAAAGDALVATFGVEQRALGSMFAVWASREVTWVLLWLIRVLGLSRGGGAAASRLWSPVGFPLSWHDRELTRASQICCKHNA